MAVALATLPLGAAAGEVYACLVGDTAGLAGCLAVDDLADADLATLATGLTIYGACGLPFCAAGLAATTGLADVPALADPPLATAGTEPALVVATGLAGATFPLLAAPPLNGLAGDFAATFFAVVFGNALAALFFGAALGGAALTEGLEAALFGATFFGAAFIGVIFLLAAPFWLLTFLLAVLAGAVFLFAAEADGFLAAAACAVMGFLATGFLATGFLAAAFLLAACLLATFDGAAALRATGFFAAGLLATGFAAGLEAPPLARLIVAATAALLALPAAFPFCAFAAVKLCVVFAISLHLYGRGGRVL